MFAMFIIEHIFKHTKRVKKMNYDIEINERQTEILELLKKEERADVSYLAKKFFASEMTIRRDLKLLEENGLLKRYRGGAVGTQKISETPIKLRRYLKEDEKKKLSEKTRKHLSDNLYVFLDSSSTCMYIAPILAEYKNIRLVTNSVQTLLYASRFHIPTMLAGGNYDEFDMCLTGYEAERYLRNISVDVAFLSSLSYSDDGIISDNNESETAVRKAVMENAKKTIFLFEPTKLHKKSNLILCRREDVSDIILL